MAYRFILDNNIALDILLQRTMTRASVNNQTGGFHLLSQDGNSKEKIIKMRKNLYL